MWVAQNIVTSEMSWRTEEKGTCARNWRDKGACKIMNNTTQVPRALGVRIMAMGRDGPATLFDSPEKTMTGMLTLVTVPIPLCHHRAREGLGSSGSSKAPMEGKERMMRSLAGRGR